MAADHILAISQAVRDGLVRRGVAPARIAVVYRGLDLDDFRRLRPEELETLRPALGLADAGPLLINVARLISRKGQDTIIRALPAVRHRHPRATLLLVGEGPYRARYEALAVAEGVSEAQEGTGVALLEAMAAARPCVVSDLPIFHEVLGDGAGLFVPAGRSDLFADAVTALLDDPEGAAILGRRARQAVGERFDIRRNALEFVKICQRVIADAELAKVEASGSRRGAVGIQ
ncbi:MAG: hypothetical protein A2V59_08175 [Armatimonadetes bacterium RBG_19FT_COMBO_69_19]|nr:MAG: hypothetical protein A2V59_08175 [Armatimonadetes bacterium RBG_19FT_COMBO_69_19]